TNLVLAGCLESISRAKRVFLQKQPTNLANVATKLDVLGVHPVGLICIKTVCLDVKQFLLARLEIFRWLLPVFVLPEPGDEDRDVIALALLGLLPLLMEKTTNAVGGGFQDNFSVITSGHRLHNTSSVSCSIGPESDLGSMEIMNRRSPAGGF